MCIFPEAMKYRAVFGGVLLYRNQVGLGLHFLFKSYLGMSSKYNLSL